MEFPGFVKFGIKGIEMKFINWLNKDSGIFYIEVLKTIIVIGTLIIASIFGSIGGGIN